MSDSPHWVKPSLRGICKACGKALWSGPPLGMPHRCEPFEARSRAGASRTNHGEGRPASAPVHGAKADRPGHP